MLNFIHQFVPSPAQESAVTLLLLHGTGGNETDLLELGRALSPEAALLSPRGQVLEHGMPRFFRRLAEGVFNLEDLQLRTHELADFVSEASDTYKFDRHHVIAIGFSNGANIAASLLLLRPGVLSAAVLLRPMVPLEPVPLPDLDNTPILICAGRSDQIVPPSNTERLAALFQECHADVVLKWQNAGHGLTPTDFSTAKAWLESALKEQQG